MSVSEIGGHRARRVEVRAQVSSSAKEIWEDKDTLQSQIWSSSGFLGYTSISRKGSNQIALTRITWNPVVSTKGFHKPGGGT